MEDQEKNDALVEVKMILDVGELGHYTDNLDNRPAMKARMKELLDEAQKFDITKLDIVTQAVVTTFWHNIVKEPKEEELLTDLKWDFALGFALGVERRQRENTGD